MHAVNIFGTGLDPDQDHLVAAIGPQFRRIRIERDLATGRARGCREAGGQDVSRRIGIERGVQQLIERHRIDA